MIFVQKSLSAPQEIQDHTSLLQPWVIRDDTFCKYGNHVFYLFAYVLFYRLSIPFGLLYTDSLSYVSFSYLSSTSFFSSYLLVLVFVVCCIDESHKAWKIFVQPLLGVFNLLVMLYIFCGVGKH